MPNTEVFTLTDNSALTATQNSSEQDVGRYTEAQLLLRVTPVSGTSPTLDIVVQCADVAGGTFHNHTTIAQITGVTAAVDIVKLTNLGKIVRLEYTITGTTPSFTVTAVIVAKT